MDALAAGHDAAVQMIDTFVVRVHQHSAKKALARAIQYALGRWNTLLAWAIVYRPKRIIQKVLETLEWFATEKAGACVFFMPKAPGPPSSRSTSRAAIAT